MFSQLTSFVGFPLNLSCQNKMDNYNTNKNQCLDFDKCKPQGTKRLETSTNVFTQSGN